MRNDIFLRQRALELILRLRERIIAPDFCTRHRRRPADFTRERKLTFPVLMLLLLQKSLKSLQTHAHEFFFQLQQGLPTQPVSASALTYARAKLQAGDFVELNRTVFDTVYGQTVEAVTQDFHATVLLSNVESVVIGPARERLAVRSATRKQPAQVNRAVSVHAIKHRLIELLSSRVSAERVLSELTEWFMANPVSVRPGRKVERRKNSPARSYHFQRRVRKLVF